MIPLALAQHDRASGTDDALARPMGRVQDVLPGLGAAEPARLAAGRAAVGRTLPDPHLRGLTGATVLAITRPAAGAAHAAVEPRMPTGREVLEAGDVLALAGTREAVDAARALLAAGAAGGSGGREELQPGDAGDDQPDAEQPGRGGRLAEQHDPEHRRADGADAGPHGVGGA